jgi:flagellar biosynthesis GTPase FlhF
VRAALTMLEERTTTRAGHNGLVRLDIGGLSVLEVRHRTSRALDPQLHTHALMIARVQGTDGRWRALDASLVFRAQRTFGSVYQSVLRSQLTAIWPGMRWGQVTKGQAEIEGMEDLVRVFSKRTAQMKERLAELLIEWRERHPERSISDKQRSELERRAAVESRPAKRGAVDARVARRDVIDTIEESTGQTVAELERGVLHAPLTIEPAEAPLSPDEIKRGAIVTLANEKSVWTREEVEREIAHRVDHTSGRSARSQLRTIEELARGAVEDYCVDLAAVGQGGLRAARHLDREPALERYTTEPLMVEEQNLVRWFSELAASEGKEAPEARMSRAVQALRQQRPTVPELDPEQIRAAAMIAGSHKGAVVIGPAGTGKTTTVQLAVTALQQERRRVIAVTPSAISADEVRRVGGLTAVNIDEYLAQRSLGQGMKPELALRAGDTLIVDEAGMVKTPHFRRLRTAVEEDGARIVLLGDHLQLSAVGRGGMFEHAREILETVQLHSVHRFVEPWEAQASLQLRAGRAEALDLYAEHGRIHTGHSEAIYERMLADWWEAHSSGESYAFSVPTVEQANWLAGRAQERRMAAGELDRERSLETATGQRLYVGDVVATRRNERRRHLVRGGRVRNRELWTVADIAPDGTLTLERLRGRDGQVQVHADYARQRIELAYFFTVHGVQGRTVQRGGTLVDDFAGFRSLYVGMTRGRVSNTAYVVADDKEAREVCERALLRDRADLGVLAQARTLESIARTRAAHAAQRAVEPPGRAPQRSGPSGGRGR